MHFILTVVLIVAKCNVNVNDKATCAASTLVLIVAKCNVNELRLAEHEKTDEY